MPKKLTRNKFIERANQIHNKKYNYSLVLYKNTSTKVKIICPVHGVFEQTPVLHLHQRCGCPSCAGNVKQTAEETRIKMYKQHKNKYSYPNFLSEYKKRDQKIDIICPEHGVFRQTVRNHLRGQGCPQCCNKGFQKKEKANFYYIQHKITGLYKIGITNFMNLNYRFLGYMQNIEILRVYTFQSGFDAFDLEQTLLETFQDVRVIDTKWPLHLGGRTEFFKTDVYEL